MDLVVRASGSRDLGEIGNFDFKAKAVRLWGLLREDRIGARGIHAASSISVNTWLSSTTDSFGQVLASRVALPCSRKGLGFGVSSCHVYRRYGCRY